MIFVERNIEACSTVLYFILIWLGYKFSMMEDVLYVNVNTNHYANLNIIICMMSQSALQPPPPQE